MCPLHDNPSRMPRANLRAMRRREQGVPRRHHSNLHAHEHFLPQLYLLLLSRLDARVFLLRVPHLHQRSFLNGDLNVKEFEP